MHESMEPGHVHDEQYKRGLHCVSVTAASIDFASMSPQEATALCANRPPRLLLRRVISTPGDRAALAKDKAAFYARAGFLLAPVAVYLVLLSNVGWTLALLAAAAVPCGAALWGYWRIVTDPAHVFDLAQWIDFQQRTWQSRKAYADASMAAVVESKSLDALMLLCTDSFSADGWETHIGLCEKAEFASDNQDWPSSFDALLSSGHAQTAHACAMTIARAWGMPCWQHSGACDKSSERLC
jgi:hypothetical protein